MINDPHQNNILVSFESVIDTDIGLLRLIKKDYNTDFFYQSILDSPEYIWKDLLNRRPVLNPLYCIMDDETEEDEELSNNLYNQFMDEEYSKILDLSPPGTLSKIVGTNFYSKDLLKLTVLCKNQMEKDILDIKEIKYHDAIIADRKEIYTPKYEIISEKSVWDIDKYINLERNTLLIPDYGFNILIIEGNEDCPLLPKTLLDKYSEKNEFRVYNAYALEADLIPD